MQRFFLRRGLVVAALLGSLSPLTTLAAGAGTLTETQRTLAYTFPAEPRVNASNNTEGTDPNYVCSPSDVPYACDTYELTVTLPPGYMALHPNDIILIEPTTTTATSDIDSQLETEDGTVLTVTRDNPPTQPNIRWRPRDGTTKYLIQIVPGTAHEGGTVDVTLLAGDPPPPPGSAYAPGFQATMSPPTLANSAGEPSIGYNPATKRGLFQAGLETLRVTFPENRTDDPLNPAGLPEACDAQWEDVSSDFTGTITLDPIGFVDPIGGRGYAGQLGPKQHTMAYTDDDGETWDNSVGNFPGAAGVDHQTIGWGPYVAGGNAIPLTDYPNAVYYCSQDIAYANCSRSDDGGASFLPPVPAYTVADCGGLHGHIRAAPDGTVYLPNKNCNNQQAVAVTSDMGTTWTVRRVPDSSPGNTDPQMALAKDGTGYFCYIDSLGTPKVAVTRDKGATWSNSFDLGAQHGINNAVFAQGIAGDGDRAACGFIGTTEEGNSDAEDFPGIWYAYMAVTYDRGQTWSVTNVTPNDPVQGAGGICTSGTTCGANRNLLDFNEMALDEKGRPVLGFADGCVGTCVTNPSSINRADKGAIARAVGGKSLYAAFDVPEPRRPQAACLAGTRTSADGVKLNWRAPAWDGRSQVTGYKIYRGTTQGAQSLIATVTPRSTYEDLTANPLDPELFYKIVAVNAEGDSVFSNLIRLTIGTGGVIETACKVPGITVAVDAGGDATTDQSQHDVRSVSIAEPYEPGKPERIYITLKVEDLAISPPNTVYYVMFRPEGDTVDRFVSYDTDAALGGFQYGHLEPGTGAGNLVTDGDADAGSVAKADGTITWILTKTKIPKLAENKTLGGVKGEARALIGAVGTGLVTVVDDSSTGSYTMIGNLTCNVNTPPQATLVVDLQSGEAPLTVTFDASGSTDSDVGDTIAEYRFDFGDGSAEVVQAAPTIEHEYTEAGFYNARVWVKDSRGLASATAAAKIIEVITAQELPPVADAGSDLTATEGALQTLDGSDSDDPNGDALTFAWVQVSGPAVTLTGASTSTPAFTAPDVCADDQVVFRLTVSDGTGLSATDDVAVLIDNINNAPVADAGADFSVKEGRSALLSAGPNPDADCEDLSYAWTQVSGPSVTLANSDTPAASFSAPTLDASALLTFRLTITDPAGVISRDDISVTVENDLSIGDTAAGGFGPAALLLLGLAGFAGRRRRA